MTLSLSDGTYTLTTPPYVRIVAVRLFPGAMPFPGGVTMQRTPANTENLLWFLNRYPHEEGTPGLFDSMRGRVSANKAERMQAELILSGDAVVRPPPSWNEGYPLRPYQGQAVALSALREGLLIGDDLGLGKTATAIGIMAQRGGRALVVCDKHLQSQWAAQVKQFCPGLRTHVITSRKEYELPPHEVTLCTYSKFPEWARRHAWDVAVYDEVQSFRHSGTAKYAAAEHIAKTASCRIGLSATPVYNFASEIFSVMEILTPGALGSRAEFFREWANGKESIADPEALGSYLRSLGIFLRRRRVDVGRELPPVNWINHTVDHSQVLIDRLRGQANELAERVLTAGFAERGVSARQLDIMLRQVTGIAKACFVADFVRELTDNGEQVLLTGWHREVYTIWQRELTKHRIPWAMFTGSESATAKNRAAQDFISGTARVLIMSLRAGAGLDGLQAASRTVVVGELDWSPQVIRQLVGRLNRDGQKDPVTVFTMISEAGADPIMARVLGAKLWDSTALTDPDMLSPEFDNQVPDNRVAEMAREWLKSQ